MAFLKDLVLKVQSMSAFTEKKRGSSRHKNSDNSYHFLEIDFISMKYNQFRITN